MNIVVKMKFGANLYGTATADSDVDYKGIFMPTKEEVLLGRIPKSHGHSTGQNDSRNTRDDIDVELYSFHYFIKLACDGQTVAMDMLHAPEEMILQSSHIWKAIIENRHRFYTRNLESFIDYARRQASKYGIKGSRINAALQVLELLKQEDPDKKMREVWDDLPRIEHCYDVAPDPNGMKQYQVCGKSFQEYLSMARSSIAKFQNEQDIRIKPYLYALRTLLCCRWIIEHMNQPPMLIQDLLKEYLPMGKIRNFINNLIELKANDVELTRIERSISFEGYMNEEFTSLNAKIPKNPANIPVEEFDSVFRDILVQVNEQHPPT